MLDYIYGTERQHFSFIRLPQILFTDKSFRSLSSDSKILYSLLLDRTSLSIKKHWLDSDGRVYINFPLSEVSEKLCVAMQKAGKIMRELESVDLIERVRLGLGKPDRIFVKYYSGEAEAEKPASKVAEDTEKTADTEQSDCCISSLQNGENHQTGDMNIITTDIPESSFPLYNQTERVILSKSDHINPDHRWIDEIDFLRQRKIYEQTIKDNIEYDWFVEAFTMPHCQNRPNGNQEELDELLNIILDCVCSTAPTIRVNGENMPTEVVRSQFLKLNSEHIQYVFDRLYNYTSEVTNIRAYLITTLYNATMTMNSAFGFDFRSTFGT